MKAVFRADPRNGFIRSSLAPADRSGEPRFGALDVCMIVGLVAGLIALMRLIVAN
jgi:hypothetical protein